MWTIIMDPTTCTSSAEHPKGKRPDHMEVITCVRAAVARTNNLSIFDHTKVVVQEKNTNNDVAIIYYLKLDACIKLADSIPTIRVVARDGKDICVMHTSAKESGSTRGVQIAEKAAEDPHSGWMIAHTPADFAGIITADDTSKAVRTAFGNGASVTRIAPEYLKNMQGASLGPSYTTENYHITFKTVPGNNMIAYPKFIPIEVNSKGNQQTVYATYFLAPHITAARELCKRCHQPGCPGVGVTTGVVSKCQLATAMKTAKAHPRAPHALRARSTSYWERTHQHRTNTRHTPLRPPTRKGTDHASSPGRRAKTTA